MSHPTPSQISRCSYLLLRDGHAVPLRGIDPESLKAGAKSCVNHPDVDVLGQRQKLTAMVGQLGFSGDHGDFVNKGYPEFLVFLKEHGCTQRAGLFPVDHGGCVDLFFAGTGGPRPRQLADRVFEGGETPPKRVFLGYGVDWDAWNRSDPYRPAPAVVATVGGERTTAEDRLRYLLQRRLDLMGQWGFLDDKLVWGPVDRVVDKTYWPASAAAQDREANLTKVREATTAFRDVFDGQPKGWVDVLKFNERLVVLRGFDGGWDVLWRDYREEAPPQPAGVGAEFNLCVEDMPARLMGETYRQRRVHLRKEAWDEKEAHEAEQAFYDRGGSPQMRLTTSDADVRAAWLREQGKAPEPVQMTWTGPLPPGFKRVVVDGRTVAISELVDVSLYRRMLVETEYATRRFDVDEPWDRANEGAASEDPVGASWADAQAFCAWQEGLLEVAVRLPTRAELRAIRPAFSGRFASLGEYDFPWECFPPRPIEGAGGSEVPSAVAWSEPRFLEPGPSRPEYPPESGIFANGLEPSGRKAWIKDFPPRAPWKSEIPWAKYEGLKFIDAWDAYEWCQEPGWISGRFWAGHLSRDSWGAYKNVKVGFRVVLDLGE